VVEDEVRLSKQLASALEQAGYAVDCATLGARCSVIESAEGLARTRCH
jgi:DNA-binding response OmpR family regulator